MKRIGSQISNWNWKHNCDILLFLDSVPNQTIKYWLRPKLKLYEPQYLNFENGYVHTALNTTMFLNIKKEL